MPKQIALTQFRRNRVVIESNGNLIVDYSLLDASGRAYETGTIQFMQVEPDPPTPDPSWTSLTPSEIAKINSLLNKVDDHLLTLLV